jgi:c-di-GMP-binding flagellar brake protein YcgR
MMPTLHRNTLLKPRIQRHRRVLHLMDVEVKSDSVYERSRSHDLSAGGMFVDSAHDYLPGMVVRLRFRLDEREFDTRAVIVHVRPQTGFGAQFLGLDAEARGHILRFVHRERATREAERVLHGLPWMQRTSH